MTSKFPTTTSPTKILSLDSSYIVDVVMSPKFGNPSISMGEIIITYHSWSWLKFINLGLALGTKLQFYTSAAKGLKFNVRKFGG